MRSRTIIIPLLAVVLSASMGQVAHAWRGGFGGFHAGCGGFTSFHSGGFGGGFGSVHYSGFTHVGYGGVTHYGGATATGWGGSAHYGGWGGYHAGYGTYGGYHAAYTEHPMNYGSITHYDAAYHVPGAYGAWGHAVAGPAGYGAAVVHGPMGGTAVAYRGPFSSGVAVKGPAGGVVAGYRGPYGAGAVAALPSGYTTTAWRGTTYYHYGTTFYHPYWYGGTVTYVPMYPPTGFFFATLSVPANPVVINNTTYYYSDGVYYQPATQEGLQGYTVVEPPSQGVAPVQLAGTNNLGLDPYELLRKMSEHIGNQRHIKMEINETCDEVAPGGQKVQFSTQRTIHMSRPDKLAVDIRGAGVQRRMVYMGGNFTLVDMLKNVYATTAMTGPLDSVLDQLASQYGMAQPADDLLYSDIYPRLSGKINNAQFVDREEVVGKKCNHLAITQNDLTWQIWIEDGFNPIPRRLVVTYENAPGRPQYTLLITKWETPLLMLDSEFKLDLPAGAVSATMLSLTGQAPTGQ